MLHNTELSDQIFSFSRSRVLFNHFHGYESGEALVPAYIVSLGFPHLTKVALAQNRLET
jgi:hypothetical protein